MSRLVALVVVLATAGVARANPIDAFGISSRGAAMGNAQAAATEDGSANYYNAAGLARGRDLRLDVGYRFAQPILKLNGHDVGVDASRGWNISLVAPGHIGPFRFAVGLAVFIPDQRLTRVRALALDKPRFSYYDNRLQRFFLVANLAVQIVPGLYIGGGLTFMSRTTGTVFLRGQIAVSDPDESSLTSAINVDLLAVRYPQGGIRWDVNKWLSLGVTYRHSFQIELSQGFRIDGSVGNPGLPPIVDKGFLDAKTLSIDLFQPWQLTAAAAVQLTPKLLFTFDLTYAHWSDHPPGATDVTLSLDIGQFNTMVDLPPKRELPAARFRNIVVPHFGAELRARDTAALNLDVRGGYVYEASVVPDQFGESSFADSDKHSFSVGAGIDFKKVRPILVHPVSLDAHFGATYLPDRAHRKVDPLHPIGDFTASGVVLQCGFTLRTRF
jgi:long-chain fatty acid transport protein